MAQRARKILDSLSPSEFSACVVDCFPEIKQKYFTEEMDRVQKTNLIITNLGESEAREKAAQWAAENLTKSKIFRRLLVKSVLLLIVVDWCRKQYNSVVSFLRKQISSITTQGVVQITAGGLVLSVTVTTQSDQGNPRGRSAPERRTIEPSRGPAPVATDLPAAGSALVQPGAPSDLAVALADASSSLLEAGLGDAQAGAVDLGPGADGAVPVPVLDGGGAADAAVAEEGSWELLPDIFDQTKYRPRMRLLSGPGIQAFYMAETELTQGQYGSLQSSAKYPNDLIQNPSMVWGDLNRPIENISWYLSLYYCNILSQTEGLEKCYILPDSGEGLKEVVWYKGLACSGYRLPTEKEWEFAARGGAKDLPAGVKTPGLVAWFQDNSGKVPHRVGTKQKNAFSLFDMFGNVAEWVWSGQRRTVKFALIRDEESGIIPAAGGTLASARGGSWNSRATELGLSSRKVTGLFSRDHETGIRLVRSFLPARRSAAPDRP